jgi:ectoine hydroxylase-related dioxygenase (phytanoyl-CoA dioxygenase family)
MDKAAYERDGFVGAIDIFSEEEIGECRRHFGELEESLGRETCSIGLVSRHFEYEFIWRMASDERIVNAISALIGDDVMLLATHFFCKYPGGEASQKFVAWHQDVTYWGLEPAEAHTAWLAVDKADRDNGCMQAVAGSHVSGAIAQHAKSAREGNLLSINQEIPDELIDKSKVRHLELEAGQISIHHGKTYHCSNPNISDRRRCGLTIRYIRPEVRPVEDKALHPQTPILLRGVDSYRNFPETSPPFS